MKLSFSPAASIFAAIFLSAAAVAEAQEVAPNFADIPESAVLPAAIAAQRNSGQSAGQQIAGMEEILRAWRESSAARLAGESENSSDQQKPEPKTQSEENLAAIRETRAMARTPQEQIALMGELFRLNAEVFAPVRPVDEAKELAQAREYLSAKTGPSAARAAAILEVRAEAATPEESVRRMGEFLSLHQPSLSAIPK